MGDVTEIIQPPGRTRSYKPKILRTTRTAIANIRYLPLRSLKFILILVGVFIVLFQWPHSLDQLSLDSSWQAALTYFGEHHFRFGPQVIYTYGPLGYVMSGLYAGGSYGWLASAAGIYVLIFAVTAALLAVSIDSLIFYAGLTIFLFWFAKYEFDSIGVLIVVFASIPCLLKHPTILKIIIASFVLGFISLVKFTFLVFSLYSVLCIAGYLLAVRRPRFVPLLLGSYLAAFLVLWIGAAHQHIGDIAVFLRGSAEVARGFPQTMGTPPPHEVVAPAAVLLGSFVLLVGLLIHATPSWPRALAMLSLFSVATLLVCEQGFVRADYDHIPVIPLTLQILAILVFALIVKEVSTQRAIGRSANIVPLLRSLTISSSAVMLFIVIGSSLAVCYLARQSKNTASLGSLPQSFHLLEGRLHLLGDYPAAKDIEYAAWLRATKAYALPELTSIMNGDTVDVVGDDVGIALLNGWNYRPRPSVQSFAAYNAYLQSEDLAFLKSKDAPEFYVVKLQPIDDRLLPETDGPALFAILANYAPAATEAGYSLFQKRPPVQPSKSPDSIAGGSARLGQSISVDPLPAGASDEIEVNLCPTLFKRLSLKNPWASLLVTQKSGNKSSFKVPPSLFRLGFVFNPAINSDLDLYAALITGNVDPIRSFSVVLPEGFIKYFRPDFTYTIRRNENTFPVMPVTDLLSGLIGFGMPIYDVQSPSSLRTFSLYNDNSLCLQAPASFRMHIPARRGTVAGDFGIAPQAFATHPDTKEVDFKIEALSKDQPIKFV